MTLVNFKFIPSTPTTSPLGKITASPNVSYNDEGQPDTTTVPVPLTVEIPSDGIVLLELDATSPEWCWKIDIQLTGVSRTIEYVTVPDIGSIDYQDLPRVNPHTITPKTDPTPAWYAALAAVEMTPGPVGPEGPAGPIGERGYRGYKGETGEPGTDGLDGSNVLPTDEAITQAITTDGTATNAALKTTYATKPEVNLLPTMSAVKVALDAGESTAVSIFGDSTGDSNGTVAANDRLSARFARQLATQYPNHHVLFKPFDDAMDKFTAWTEIQAHADGRRYANFGGSRSMRHVPRTTDKGKFTSGNMDLRALIAPDTWTPASTGVIIARVAGETEAYGTAFQFRWLLNPSGTIGITWSTDGTTWNSTKNATIPVPGVDGTPMWIRVTVEIDTTTGWTVTFWTSPANDGDTWTQLGDPAAWSGGTSALFDSPGYFEVGAHGWQPAGQALAAKVYEVQIRDGLDGPLIAPGALEAWERYGDPSTTFGGAPTLYILNASESSSKIEDHTARVAIETPDYGQVAAIFNDGHNEGIASGSQWIPPYEAWVDTVKDRLPSAAINVIGQNPHLPTWANEDEYGPEHVKRIMELSAAAGRNGWGFINIYQAYLDDPRGLEALIGTDGLHPTQAGYELSGDTVAATTGI